MDSNGINIFSSEIFTPLMGGLQRYLTELQSSLSQHYTLDLTFAEDETLSIDFATTSTGNEEALLGDNPSAHALLIRTDGKIELVGATTVVFNSVVTDGSLNTFQIVRTGTGVEGFLNGATDGTGTISGDIDFTRIAGQNGNYFNGIIANLTKDLTHDLPLDEDFSTTSTAVNLGAIGASGNATAVNITESDLFTQVVRNYTELLAADSQYWAMDSTVTFAGDFEIEVDVAVSAETYNQHIVDSSADRILMIIIQASGVVTFFVGGIDPWVVVISSVTNITDGLLHRIRATKEGNWYRLFIDGVQEAAVFETDPVAPSLTQVGRSADGGTYFTGIIANLKLTDAGTLIHSWPLDSADPSTELDTIGSNNLTGTNLDPSDVVNLASWNNPTIGTIFIGEL